MAQPNERGVWIGKRVDKDGMSALIIVTSTGALLLKGKIRRSTWDHERSRAFWHYLNHHDAAIRLTA